jgi:hypothetical protein
VIGPAQRGNASDHLIFNAYHIPEEDFLKEIQN